MEQLFDINRYRQQLDQAMSSLNGDPSGQGPNIGQPMDQGSGSGSNQAPQNLSSAQPQSQNQSTAPNVAAGPSAVPVQSPPASNLGSTGFRMTHTMKSVPSDNTQSAKIEGAPPDMKLTPDPDKLKDAKHVGDVLDSLPKSQAEKYMDWWEKEHGSIDAKFNQMNSSLGVRPDKDATPTRKDMFRMLMDFGLNLIKNSSPQNSAGRGVNIASAVGQAVGNQEDYQAQQQHAYDQRAQNVETMRQGAFKNLGTRGQAMESAGRIQAEEARQQTEGVRSQAEQARIAMYEGKYDKDNIANPNNPIVDPEGNLHFTTKTGKDIPLKDARGNPVKQNLSAMKGRGGLGHKSVFQEKMDAYDKLNPLPKDASQSDIEKHNLDALRYSAGGHSEMSSDMLVKAQRMAVQYLGPTDGEDAYQEKLKQKTSELLEAMQQANEPKKNLSASGTPPLSELEEGVVTKFKNGKKWSLVNGKPTEVP